MYLLLITGPLVNILCLSLFNIIFSLPLISGKLYSTASIRFFYIFWILFSLLSAFVFLLLPLYEVFFLNSTCFLKCCLWFKISTFEVSWSFLFDTLTIALLLLIILISFLVHLFALDYLSEDPHLMRFLNLLTLFTIFMELLVTSGNLVQFFFGWEGVGLMSFLLINFWFTRYAAANSGVMAIIYNKIGDCGLLVGICIVVCFIETTDFINIFVLIKSVSLYQIKLFSSYFFIFDILTVFLVLGVIGKSAQIFLESWLASAMEGPTPVSSLLHASTMIVSGVFLLQRFQILIFTSMSSIIFITFVGGLTCFFAGTIGLVSMDLKRIIAYSTCSQMGYLVFCVGIGNTNISLFHLFNHAFFKCLLFVAAGTIIHSLYNNQDIRLMGGLLKSYPFIYLLILIASLSLMGLPFFSGYYSKEKILEYSFYIFNNQNLFSFWFGSMTAFLTSIYSMRLLFYVFLNQPNSLKINYQLVTTNVASYLNIVFFILGFGSVFTGFFFEETIISTSSNWNIFNTNNLSFKLLDIHSGNILINYLPFIYTCGGIFISSLIIVEKNFFKQKFIFNYLNKNFLINRLKLVYFFLSKRWFLNTMYNRFLVQTKFVLGYSITFILLDKGFFELPLFLSIRFLSNFTKILSSKLYRQFSISDLLIFLSIVLLGAVLTLMSTIAINNCYAVPRKKGTKKNLIFKKFKGLKVLVFLLFLKKK